MDIQTTHHAMGGFNNWSAIDANTYDADCDQDGFFSTSPRGWGRTEAEAIEDLKAQIEADFPCTEAGPEDYTALNASGDDLKAAMKKAFDALIKADTLADPASAINDIRADLREIMEDK